MTNEQLFRRAMHSLAVNFGRDLDTDSLEVYWRALKGCGVTDDEFATAVTLALRQDLTMPPIARLLVLARPETDAHAEGVRVFGLIDTCRSYNPAVGEYVSSVKVLSQFGQAAHDAFMAIGGKVTWAGGTPHHRLRDFLTVYEAETAIWRRDSTMARISGPRAKALPAVTQ